MRQWAVVGAFAAVVAAACGQGSSSSPTAPTAPTTPAPVSQIRLATVLGRPTDTSIAVSVVAEAGAEISVEYGTSSARYTAQTPVSTATGRGPVVIDVTGLAPDTRYYYRTRARLAGQTAIGADAEQSFHTARRPGSAFTFGIQGDSHPERTGKMFSADLYARNLQNVAGRRPDFYVCLGDDFSIESLINSNQVTTSGVEQVYRTQRDFLAAAVAPSTPIFLVNGNHEEAARYLINGRYNTPFANAAIFAGSSRVTWFPLPSEGPFYSVDDATVPGIGPLRDYYAWEWGDALFVVIDPYWHSPVPVDAPVPGVTASGDDWAATIGDAQYQWLKRTLEASRARWKFVLTHHVLGTGRGAASLVHLQEWGGYSKKGAYEFPAFRPGWARPIHQLLKANNVTMVLFGHDHLFAREKVDGVIYQSVPNPADNTYTAFNADAYVPSSIRLPGAAYDAAFGVTMSNSGFLEVSVAPESVTVSYVRAVLPGDDTRTGGVSNDGVAFSYVVPKTGDSARPVSPLVSHSPTQR
jgi:hypothetical protein